MTAGVEKRNRVRRARLRAPNDSPEEALPCFKGAEGRLEDGGQSSWKIWGV